jgi:hypothetical protein
MDVQLEDKDVVKVDVNGDTSVMWRTNSSSQRLRVTSRDAKIILFVSPDTSADRRLRINFYTVEHRESRMHHISKLNAKFLNKIKHFHYSEHLKIV